MVVETTILKVLLRRYYQDQFVTLGFLQVQNELHKPIYTLENPWKNNSPNVSCIPRGVYNCKSYSSNKYKNVWEVTNVPNRSYILFHRGNYERDTRGCILPGLSVDPERSQPMVGKSGLAMAALKMILLDNEFQLTIEGI